MGSNIPTNGVNVNIISDYTSAPKKVPGRRKSLAKTGECVTTTIQYKGELQSSAQATDAGGSVGALERIRLDCLALRLILLPDNVWPAFQSWHTRPDCVAAHRSVVLLALERGYLSRVTAPIHRFLLAGDDPLPSVRRQYLSDLTEGWMQREDAVDRHHKSKMFRGRLAELQFAEWLECHDWSVRGLEALREGPDVEAASASGVVSAFEIKFIGAEDEYFRAILTAITGQASGGAVSAYNGVNYLLFRLYEAAKQLERVESRRVAVAIVDELTWWRVDLQLRNGWIDWAAPKFLFPDRDWEKFIAAQEHKYPDLQRELATTLRWLDGAWVIRESAGFDYTLEYELPVRSA